MLTEIVSRAHQFMQTIRNPNRHGKQILESVLNLDPPKVSETDAALAKATITKAVKACAVIKARANLRVAKMIYENGQS